MNSRRIICFIYASALLIVFSCPYAMSDSGKTKVDYSDYLQDIQLKIKRKWHPPKLNKPAKPIVFFRLSKTGELIEERIKNPSNNAKMDQSVLDAVKEVGIFPAPPGKEEISVEFTFDYKVVPPLRTNWDNLFKLDNLIYDFTHFRTLKYLAHVLEKGDINAFLYRFGPFLLLIFVLLLFAVHLYTHVKVIAKATTWLPAPETFISLASDRLGISHYPTPYVNWNSFCKVDYFKLILFVCISIAFIICGLRDYWAPYVPASISNNEFFKGSVSFLELWSVPILSFYFWSGLFVLYFGLALTFGLPRYFRHLREITSRPGKVGAITIKAGSYFPYIARVDRYNDGTSTDTSTFSLKPLSLPSFPEKLPLTEKAEIYVDEETGKPIAIRICGGLLYVVGSGLYRKSILMPWTSNV